MWQVRRIVDLTSGPRIGLLLNTSIGALPMQSSRRTVKVCPLTIPPHDVLISKVSGFIIMSCSRPIMLGLLGHRQVEADDIGLAVVVSLPTHSRRSSGRGSRIEVVDEDAGVPKGTSRRSTRLPMRPVPMMRW